MSVKKKVVASIIIVSLIVIVGYFLISAATSGRRPGQDGGLGSVDARTLATLTVVGGSAFITGFGMRDVIGRAVAARQRSRAKSVQQQPVRH